MINRVNEFKEFYADEENKRKGYKARAHKSMFQLYQSELKDLLRQPLVDNYKTIEIKTQQKPFV